MNAVMAKAGDRNKYTSFPEFPSSTSSSAAIHEVVFTPAFQYIVAAPSLQCVVPN